MSETAGAALFVPGDNARAQDKAVSLPADTIILDLEDAVAPAAKDAAREAVCARVAARAYGARQTVVRINALDSAWGAADVKAIAPARPDAILLPKVTGPADLAAAAMLAPGVPLWAMIETPRAILNLSAIAGFGAPLACLVLGANDLLKEMGGRHRDDRANLHFAMASVVTAARAHGLSVLDAVHNDFHDTEGFAAACALARDFGFDGKTLIHPSQIEPARAAFLPSPDEVARARALIAAFGAEDGVIAFEGRMAERLDLEIARRTLARAGLA